MSINWVMLSDTQGFVRLPGETPVWKSSPRTALSITTPRAYPAHNPFTINSSLGTVYLTNQRVVYLPEKPTNDFKSFSASLLNLHDTHVTVPWFGPNSWQALVQPVPGGNIPAGHSAIELKLTFKEGGAPDFHSNFERIKERLQQAVEAARDSNMAPSRQNQGMAGVNLESVHLDQLPSYEASGNDMRAPTERLQGSIPVPAPNLIDEPVLPLSSGLGVETSVQPRTQTQTLEPPAGAPPGYEETQQQSLQAELDRRLSQT